jgi:hypothetical protein
MNTIKFRKVKRFSGTKNCANYDVILQYQENDLPWIDILNLSKIENDGGVNFIWENDKESEKYTKSLEREYAKFFR